MQMDRSKTIKPISTENKIEDDKRNEKINAARPDTVEANTVKPM